MLINNKIEMSYITPYDFALYTTSNANGQIVKYHVNVNIK